MAKFFDSKVSKNNGKKRRRLMLPVSAYVKIRAGRIHQISVAWPGHVWFAFDKAGELIGVEVI